MPSNFPTSLDALTNPNSGDSQTSPSHSGQHANANDALEALEAKVGITSSTDLTTLENRSHGSKIATHEPVLWDDFHRSNRNIATDVAPTKQVWKSTLTPSGTGTAQILNQQLVYPVTGFSAYNWLSADAEPDIASCEFAFSTGSTNAACAGFLLSKSTSSDGLTVAQDSVHCSFSTVAWEIGVVVAGVFTSLLGAAYGTALTADGTTRHRATVQRVGHQYLRVDLPDGTSQLIGPDTRIGRQWGKQVLIEHFQPASTDKLPIFLSVSASRTPGIAVDVQTFTANGTWYKPSAPQYTEVAVWAIAGGSGGGSGRRGAAGTVRCGGGGGAAAAIVTGTFPIASLAATETVVVGAGGAGGAAVTANDTSGNAGGGGNASQFSVTNTTLVYSFPPTGGGGGTAAAGAGGAQGIGDVYIAGAGSGGAADASGGAGGSGGTATSFAAAGGGAGGGVSAANVAAAGGLGFYSAGQWGGVNFGAGGAASGGAGSAPPSPPPVGSTRAGGGGGGGGGHAAGVGGAGGAGSRYGGGGGGGGGSVNGSNSGAGGAGGAGLVVVVTR